KESTDTSEESCNSKTESTTDVEESSDSAHDMEEESKKILQEMETISREVQESKFYSELHKQIKSEEFQSQLTRVLASHSRDVPMVIYALGSLEEGNSSKYQLAVALLLQQDFFNWITSIEVFDPVLSPTDIIVLEKLGCTVLTVNEDCKRRVERPTLFFMPYVSTDLTGNLLEANWSPPNINQVILLTNKLSKSLEHYQVPLREGERYADRISFVVRMEYLEAIQKCIQEIKINGNFVDNFLDDLIDVTDNALVRFNFANLPFTTQMQYLEAIQKYTEEIGIRSLGEPKDNLLYNFAFHFFNVPPEIDMQTLLQVVVPRIDQIGFSHDVGSLERATPPKYQLAFALLLQQDFFGWITRIEVFDPSLSLADILVLEKFGCTVLWMNEECRRRVDSPTLFFMPYASKSLQGNLLEANWWPSNINQVILLTNRLSATVEDYHDFLRDGTIFNLDSFMENWEYLEAIHKCIQEINIHTNSENFADSFLAHLKDVTNNRYLHYQFYDLPFMIKMQYLEAIQNYTEEMRISLGQPADNLLYNFAFHFFNVAPEIDMQTLLQGEEEDRLNFRRQFDKIWKIEEYQIVALIEALIINAWYEQMAETENDL
ncbi:SRR1-like domain - like 3, partial [Theobroma cacao]